MKVKFWGVRGSIPTPAHSTDSVWKLEKIINSALKARLEDNKSIRKFIDELPPYLLHPVGGNTPCVEVRHGDDLIVLDAGSGLRPLGLELNKDAVFSESELYLAIEAGHKLTQYERREIDYDGIHLNFLISHTHWDHLQGFPFFTPAYNPDTTIAIYGRSDEELAKAFEIQQMAPSMFPIALGDMGSKISFNTFPAEGLTIGGLTIQAMPVPHPGGSLAFRITAEGRSMVYATDYEFSSIDSDEAGDFVNFIKNADLLISDTQYTYLEGAAREGWGHSTSFGAMDLAMRAGVAAFYMFHHDPTHDDAKLFANLEKTRAYHTMMSGRAQMAIELAIEGMTLEV
ncbi:hypothetical protein C4J81_07330 [Deltaproteobacteria bacterium Smac51]|nr:hypothetical protein C4J81_07330 [Deltaproteobacteria bacterium Smac51]